MSRMQKSLLPHAPCGRAGIFINRGQPVPALDLCALTLSRPARTHLSTRILIVQHTQSAGQPQLIGLIAERVAGTLQREEKDFVNVDVETVAAPFLGPVVMDAQGIIQILDAQKLLDAGAHQLQLTHAPEAEISHPLPSPALPPHPGSLGAGGGAGSGPQNYAPH